MPELLLAGTYEQYKCPDGTVYITDTGIPQELANRGCKLVSSMQTSTTGQKELDLEMKKRYCEVFCKEFDEKARQVEESAKRSGDSLEFERARKFRKYIVEECPADCIDNNLKKTFRKESKSESENKQLENKNK